MTVRARPILSGGEFEVLHRPPTDVDGLGRALKDGTIVVGLDLRDHPEWVGKCLWLDLDFGAAAPATWAFVDYLR